MNKRGVSSPVGFIMFTFIFILIMAFIYPIINSFFIWFGSLHPFLKFASLILGLLSLGIIFKEMQPQSTI